MTTMLQTYPKYAKSGPVWFGELPDEWGVVPMRSLFETKKQFVADKSDQHLLLSLTMGGVKHRDLCGRERIRLTMNRTRHSEKTIWLHVFSIMMSPHEQLVMLKKME